MRKLVSYQNLLVVLIIIMSLLYLVRITCQNNKEYMVNISPISRPIKWKRNKNCNYLMTKTLKTVLNKNLLQETKKNDYVVYFPCTYNKIKNEIDSISPNNEDQRFFIVNNADQLTSKSAIWKNLVKTYGREQAKIIMPTTYILNNPFDIILFLNEFKKNKIYILKKNIQRQKGLKITRNKNEILNAKKEKYVVVQELLQNPYLIDGRKINMRFYLLLVCKNNEISSYVHKGGFMYYTKTNFKKNSIDDDSNITTGYIDRSVYEKNPLTLEDFRKYLDNHNRSMSNIERSIVESNMCISSITFNKIYDLLRKIVIAVKDSVCIDSHLKKHLTFQLFGVDIALNNKLEPQLMEINKGPDLGVKSKRDGIIKYGVITDIFKVMKVIKNNNHNDHGFIKILE